MKDITQGSVTKHLLHCERHTFIILGTVTPQAQRSP
jgi:hypothetical protein